MKDYALVLLSGGMDSAVALFWAKHQGQYKIVDALTIDYGQVSKQELVSSNHVWYEYLKLYDTGIGTHMTMIFNLFPFSNSSILGYSAIDQYDNVEQAIRNTSKDSSYIPLRNAILVSIASSFLLTQNPKGGDIVMGIRGRRGPGGFADCTHTFAAFMSSALTEGSGKPINIVDPLNGVGIHGRLGTLQLAQAIPGCFEALQFTNSCFKGSIPPCGHCLPCLRRAQAFQELGMPDPAIDKVLHV